MSEGHTSSFGPFKVVLFAVSLDAGKSGEGGSRQCRSVQASL